MFGLVREEGLGVMCYSPLAVGLLSGVYSPDEPPPAGTLWGTRLREEFSQRMSGATGQVVTTPQATRSGVRQNACAARCGVGVIASRSHPLRLVVATRLSNLMIHSVVSVGNSIQPFGMSWTRFSFVRPSHCTTGLMAISHQRSAVGKRRDCEVAPTEGDRWSA